MKGFPFILYQCCGVIERWQVNDGDYVNIQFISPSFAFPIWGPVLLSVNWTYAQVQETQSQGSRLTEGEGREVDQVEKKV